MRGLGEGGRMVFGGREVGMIGYIEAPEAWTMTQGMARVLGLNLVEAVTEGWFARTELAQMVDDCVRCDQSDRCTAFLAVTVRTESLPGFCMNKARIEALQP